MILDLSPEKPPIIQDSDGTARVSGTRVTLKTVAEAFLERSRTPEQIAEDFRLQLGDVYSVIGYCLRRKEEVSAYLQELARLDELWWKDLQAEGLSPDDWRQRLRERAQSHPRR